MKHFLPAIILILLVIISGGVASYWYLLGPGTGSFTLLLTDPPIYPSTYVHINVTFSTIAVRTINNMTWQPLAFSSSIPCSPPIGLGRCFRIDLFSIINATVPMASGTLPGNVYQIQLNITQVTLQINSPTATTYTLTLSPIPFTVIITIPPPLYRTGRILLSLQANPSITTFSLNKYSGAYV